MRHLHQLGLAATLLAAACTGDSPTTGRSAEELNTAQCDYFAGPDGKVGVCHHTGSARKPFTIHKVSVAGCYDHGAHDDDFVTSVDPSSRLYDPDCSGQGCLPAGAPSDGTIECCAGLTGAGGSCVPLQVCGDGILDGAEQCDDGNNLDGDGCSSSCTIEPPPPPADCGPTIGTTHFAASGATTYLPTENDDANAVAFDDSCPCGSFAVGFSGATYNWFGFSVITRFALTCQTASGYQFTTARGSDAGTTPFARTCPFGSALSSQTLGWNIAIHSIAGRCRSLFDGSDAGTLGPVRDTTGVGASDGTASADCPAGMMVTGAQGRHGSVLDSLGFHCRVVSALP